MPPIPTSHRELVACFSRAAKVYNRALIAYEAEVFTPHHAKALAEAEQEVGRMLAYFEDGPGFGKLCKETTSGMVDYCQDAEELRREATARPGVREDWRHHGGGQYSGLRLVQIAGRPYQKLVNCTNPAVGTLELDKWEAELRESLAFLVEEKAA